MLHWLWMAIIGLIIGALAKLIMPGKDAGGKGELSPRAGTVKGRSWKR